MLSQVFRRTALGDEPRILSIDQDALTVLAGVVTQVSTVLAASPRPTEILGSQVTELYDCSEGKLVTKKTEEGLEVVCRWGEDLQLVLHPTNLQVSQHSAPSPVSTYY